MASKSKAIVILTAVLVSSLLNFGNRTSYAEGDKVCTGKITGTTRDFGAAGNDGTNKNSGRTTFDAHPVGNQAGLAVDYSGSTYHTTDTAVVTAPATRGDAACIHTEALNAYEINYDYALKGWAWNSNAGFVSFSCKAGFNNAGGMAGAVSCGAFDYGVYVSKDKGIANDLALGVRDLFGYAWNPTFGYIKFHNDPAEVIKYGVKIDSNGNSSGYAWTSAGIYLDFTGLVFNLPGKVVVKDETPYCTANKTLCATVSPDPGALQFGTANDVKVADGIDGYNLSLYFNDKDGNPINAANINPDDLGKIVFDWEDTVKLNQVDDIKVMSGIPPVSGLNKISSPWAQPNPVGGVTFKPLSFSDFKPVTNGADGKYITNQPITSYAPTTESKLSSTTTAKIKPAYLVKNDTFVAKPDGLQLPKEPNYLKLKAISFPPLRDKNNLNNVLIGEAVVYPNKKAEVALRFRPAIYVNTLVSGVDEDSISGYRGVFMLVTKGLRDIGKWTSTPEGNVDFNIGYSSDLTQAADPTCEPGAFNFEVTDDLAGVKNPSDKVTVTNKISDLAPKQNTSSALKITPTIPSDPDKALPCNTVNGATVYSVVSYTVNGKPVSYFDNKLPRVGDGTIANPAAVVHGNIIAQAITAVQQGQPVQTSGSVNIRLVRDAINENLKKNLGVAPSSSIACIITGLTTTAATTCGSNNIATFTVGAEKVLYSTKDITLKLTNGTWDGKWVIVADGANIFVDGNLYNATTTTQKISLVSLRSAANYYTTGNIYIHPDVTNIQATLVADGSLFSYNGNHPDINATTGEPTWAGGYSEMTSTLNKQLLIKGAISSKNTIGGANLNQGKDAKKILLLGGGKTVKADSLENLVRAQYYDLNYLRMFKLGVKLTEEGFPIDQKCGMGWTSEDQTNLNNIYAGLPTDPVGLTEICGAYEEGCIAGGGTSQETACDGINPMLQYDAVNSPTGDLVVEGAADTKAEELGANDINPVYVYYSAPDKDSFVFSKKSTTNIGGQ